MECLLAYIEITQFQRYVLSLGARVLSAGDEHDEEIRELVEFPSNIPMSAIVENDDVVIPMDAAKMKAHALYNKYVRVGSEYVYRVYCV